MEWGERLDEAVHRETEEETGLDIAVGPLIAFFADPELDRAVVQPDGSGGYPVGVGLFHCKILNGEPGLSDETTEVGWYSQGQLPDLWAPHRRRVQAGFESLD